MRIEVILATSSPVLVKFDRFEPNSIGLSQTRPIFAISVIDRSDDVARVVQDET